MNLEPRKTDAKGRVCLPKSFAGSTVIIEEVSDTELRIRKAVVLPEEEARFLEESSSLLSDRERDAFLQLLDTPPPANAALKRAAKRAGLRHD